jgi:hypothetical protein
MRQVLNKTTPTPLLVLKNQMEKKEDESFEKQSCYYRPNSNIYY